MAAFMLVLNLQIGNRAAIALWVVALVIFALTSAAVFVALVLKAPPLPFLLDFLVAVCPYLPSCLQFVGNHRQHLPLSRGQKGHSMDDAHTKLTWWQLALLLSAVLGFTALVIFR